MELKYFRLIKTIAEEGNISNSATRLFLTQSALSHQLRSIEDQMRFKIFLRKRNQWTLTEEGKELYQLANTVLAQIDQGLTNIQKIKEGSKGKIRISTECYSFYQGLPKFIQKMSLLYPEILIDLDVEATHRPVSKILSKELDMAIVTTKPINENLVSLEVFEDEIYALLHQENP
ncbi:MAG: LysR family transcriptional regulator, partial [Bacteroidota bacterium]